MAKEEMGEDGKEKKLQWDNGGAVKGGGTETESQLPLTYGLASSPLLSL
jgi:hypothetical protein